MPEDVSIYAVALVWLRVPSHLLPAVIIALLLLGLILLRNSRLANVKTKKEVAEEACDRIERIRAYLDVALRELVSASPDLNWEPPDLRPGMKISSKGLIDPATDERCRWIVDDLSRVCDAHLPEFRERVLDIEDQVREFARQRLEVSSRHDLVSELESELAALSAAELKTITTHGAGHGWGDTFVDPMRVPMEKRSSAATEARIIADSARRAHEEIKGELTRLSSELRGA